MAGGSGGSGGGNGGSCSSSSAPLPLTCTRRRGLCFLCLFLLYTLPSARSRSARSRSLRWRCLQARSGRAAGGRGGVMRPVQREAGRQAAAVVPFRESCACCSRRQSGSGPTCAPARPAAGWRPHPPPCAWACRGAAACYCDAAAAAVAKAWKHFPRSTDGAKGVARPSCAVAPAPLLAAAARRRRRGRLLLRGCRAFRLLVGLHTGAVGCAARGTSTQRPASSCRKCSSRMQSPRAAGHGVLGMWQDVCTCGGRSACPKRPTGWRQQRAAPCATRRRPTAPLPSVS